MLRSLALCLLVVTGCKKLDPSKDPAVAPVVKGTSGVTKIGLVTDLGGRGDQSFNDSALRGLELWAANAKYTNSGYQALDAHARKAVVPVDMEGAILPLSVKPVVLQSRAQEDYQPNLQLLAEQGCALTIGVGFMLENAVESAAKENSQARFLLVDSPILDASGNPQKLPNVRTVVFKEEEGSFLVGALAGLLAKEKVGFVGGMELPLIKKFEAGFRAGVMTVNPKMNVLVSYTGSFDKVAVGKAVGQDFMAKGVEIVFHAAGSDGLGVIQAAKEAKAAGKNVYAIGVDSDQHAVAPEVMLTSMVKRVDMAVYQAIKDVVGAQFTATDEVMGLKEKGVDYAPIRLLVPGKDEAVATVERLRKMIIERKLRVPANLGDLQAFTPPSLSSAPAP